MYGEKVLYGKQKRLPRAKLNTIKNQNSAHYIFQYYLNISHKEFNPPGE